MILFFDNKAAIHNKKKIWSFMSAPSTQGGLPSCPSEVMDDKINEI